MMYEMRGRVREKLSVGNSERDLSKTNRYLLLDIIYVGLAPQRVSFHKPEGTVLFSPEFV